MIAVLGLVLTLVLIRSSDSRAHVELGDKDAGQASTPPARAQDERRTAGLATPQPGRRVEGRP